MSPMLQQKMMSGKPKRSISNAVTFGWVVFVPCGCASSATGPDNQPKNIILFIGGGMGGQHPLVAQWSSAGQNGRLQMDDLPHLGAVRTRSVNQAITDPAAAAPAMATGIKRNNGIRPGYQLKNAELDQTSIFTM